MSYATNLNTYLNPDPQTILRRGNYGTAHYEEYTCGANPPYPGMLVEILSNGTCQAQSSVGGDVPVIVAVEDALQGLTINDQYSVNNIVRCLVAEPGHVVQGPIAAGTATTVGQVLISAGDGSWKPLTGSQASVLYVTNANSNTVTNTVTTTSFGQTFAIPAGMLLAGDVIHVIAEGICPSTNSTDTVNVALKFGSTTIASTGAVDVANNDRFRIDATIVVRAVGDSGAIVAAGSTVLGVPGTATDKVFGVSNTAANTNANITVDVTATWSVASASNQIQMDILAIELERSTKAKPLGMAYTAVNNVAGNTYEFVDILIF